MEVGNELTRTLEKLKVKDGGKWKSIYQALRTLLKKDKLEELNQRLRNLREDMMLHFVAIIRYCAQNPRFLLSNRFG